MTGADVKQTLLDHVPMSDELFAALAPCIVLTAEEAADVLGAVEHYVAGGQLDRAALALLTPDQEALIPREDTLASSLTPNQEASDDEPIIPGYGSSI